MVVASKFMVVSYLVRVERKREHEYARAQVLGHRLGCARLRALGRLGTRLLDGARQPAKLGERQQQHRAEGAEHQQCLPPTCRTVVSSWLSRVPGAAHGGAGESHVCR